MIPRSWEKSRTRFFLGWIFRASIAEETNAESGIVPRRCLDSIVEKLRFKVFGIWAALGSFLNDFAGTGV